MSNHSVDDPILNLFIFETTMQIERVEANILESERYSYYTSDEINDIFRIMRKLKVSSAMMLFNDVSQVAQSMENLFYFISNDKTRNYDYQYLTVLLIESLNFLKEQLEKIKSGSVGDGDCQKLITKVESFFSILKRECFNAYSDPPLISEKQRYYITPKFSDVEEAAYKAVLYFGNSCKLENICAYTVIHSLKEIATEIYYIPGDIFENKQSEQLIRDNGFLIYFKAGKSYEHVKDFFMQIAFLRTVELEQLENDLAIKEFENRAKEKSQKGAYIKNRAFWRKALSAEKVKLKLQIRKLQ